MKILSWDVGIINLAFCLIDYDIKTKKWTILDWNIINLSNRKKLKCTDCKAKPTYYQSINQNQKYYCKRHVKKVNCQVPEFESLFNLNKESVCNYFFKQKKINCNKKCKYQYGNNYYCNSHSKIIYKHKCNEYNLIQKIIRYYLLFDGE